ncbi:MAG: hypothetical protein EOP49_23845, partial [Sphingobacteriales bacterium]
MKLFTPSLIRSTIPALFLLLCAGISICKAQQFGGHPPSQRWRQVNTDSIRIIFPPGLETQAMEIADISRALQVQTRGSIGARGRKISIVLQHQTTSSNGYVGLGPWRSEFYLTPLQNNFSLGSLPWHKSLALHEFRHVQQYSNFRKGVSRVAHAIFGEQVEALVTSAAVPDYFWEGDAVYQETLMSEQGRGRIPYFYNGYRSLWAADKKYNWQKLRNGSLRDYVPDHYQLGYLLVAYGRKQFGDSIWAKVTNDAVRYRGLFYPWQRAIERHTGMNYPTFRSKALADGETSLGGAGDDSLAIYASGSKHFAGDQLFPVWIGDEEVLMVQSDYKNIPAFVVHNIRTRRTRSIRKRDIAPDQYYSYRNGKIVYAAYAPDLRWGWRDYSGIRIVDVNSGKQRVITIKTKYFSPDISADGRRIVAVHATADSNAVHLLTVEGSVPVQVVPNPEKLVFTYPKFMDDPVFIVAAARNLRGEMALVKLRLEDGTMENLTPWSPHVIGYPLVQGDTITFTASVNGSDALFALKGDQLYRLNTEALNAATGNYQLSVRNNQFSWSAFSAVGYRLQVSSAAPLVRSCAPS